MPILGKNSARLLVTGALAAVLPFTLASPVVHAHTAPGDDVGAAEVVSEPQDIVDEEGTDEDVEVMSMQASPEVWASLPRGGRGIMDERALINAVEDYWTPERIANATERTVPAEYAVGASIDVESEPLVASNVSKSDPQRISHPTNPSVETEAWKAMPKKNWATGKLFMTDKNGKNYACTAAVVNSSNKRLISTASHCLHDADTKAYFRNVTFMGGYKGMERRNLTFVIDKVATSPFWRSEGKTAKGYWYDYAFASTHPNRLGNKIVHVLGAHGFVKGVNTKISHEVVLPAYPRNIRSGQFQIRCDADSHRASLLNDDKTIKYPMARVTTCGYNKGASGGPWLYAFSEHTGHGYIAGVTSSVDIEKGEFIMAPFFRNSALSYYNRINK